MEKSEREKRTEKMLILIEERLAGYTVEETIERLASYKGEGPTVDDFLQTLKDSN